VVKLYPDERWGGVGLREIGHQLGISYEMVRQIEKRALAKARSWCQAHGYELEDLLVG
jgi:DNA-directed RNA polymerase sigma subunit (sigma70/sigma32)